GNLELRRKIRRPPLVVLLRKVAEWPWPREETTMKRNHLFASAAIGAVLAATLPVHAQMLGGGVHGGVSSTQSARFGGGFRPTHSAVSNQTDLSAAARAG